MVAKDTYLVSTQWVSRDEKHRKQDPDTKEWLPREAYMTKRLQGLDSLHHCIVRFLGNRVVASHKMYRIYMELCPFGDLKELIKSHYDISQCVDRNGNRISGYAMQEAKNAYFWLTRRRAIPENVLWSLFESLAAAACIMESGHLPDLPPPKVWPKEIMHLDMKPANIFLSDPREDTWPNYPTFKLGGFRQC